MTNTWWLVFMVAPECIRCHFRKSLKISSIVKATDQLIPYWLVNCAWLYTISFTSNTFHALAGGYDNKIHVRWWWLHPIISMTKYKWDITLNINIYISIYAYAVRDVYVNSETHYTKTHNNYLNYYQFSVMRMYIWRIEGNEHFASAERKLNDPLNKQRDMVLCFCLPRNGCEYSTNNNMSTFCFGRLNQNKDDNLNETQIVVAKPMSYYNKARTQYLTNAKRKWAFRPGFWCCAAQTNMCAN